MSSAWTSVSPKRGDQVGLGIVRLADDANHLVDGQQRELPAFEDVDAPSTLPSRCSRSARDRCQAELVHSSTFRFSVFERGRPSRPSITRLIGRLDSRRVLASSKFMNSCGSWRLDFGSSTMRTGRVLVGFVAHRVERGQHQVS